jgi:hypothetical protein
MTILYWEQIRDGDERAFQIYSRHYTFPKRRTGTGKNGKRIAGPGETIILLGKDEKALFVWRKQRYARNGQFGINCVIFRNENPRTKENPTGQLSSDILLEAEQFAELKWPGERLFTYVNPKKVKSANPGYCYKAVGWHFCGITKKRKYHILEKIPK